jgi:hypothetical protein
MTPAERDAARILAFADSLEPSLARAYLDAVASLSSANLAELTRRIAAGDVEGALNAVFSAPDVVAAFASLRSKYAGGVIRLTARAVRALPRAGRIIVQAPVLSPAIIAGVRRWEDGAFARVALEIRAGLRETIATELAKGIGPRQVAGALRATISSGGLTEYDVRIVGTFRKALEEGRLADALDRTLRNKRYDKALRRGDLTPAEIEKMVAAYRSKLVGWRAQTFARTSAIQAANDATSASWAAGIEQGAFTAAEVRRYWVTAADERLCDVCEPIPSMNESGVGLNDPFMTPEGAVMGPTLHPNCRCTVWIRLERAGVQRAARPGSTRLVQLPS